MSEAAVHAVIADYSIGDTNLHEQPQAISSFLNIQHTHTHIYIYIYISSYMASSMH